MNILLNFSNISKGGGLQVAHSFISFFSEKQNFINTSIVISLELNKQLDKKVLRKFKNVIIFNNNFKFINIFTNKNSFFDNLVLRHEISVVFTLFGPSYWRPKCFHICGFAKPQYIYTESPFFKMLSIKEKIKLKVKKHLQMKSFLCDVDVFHCETLEVRKRLIKLYGIRKPIHVIPNSVNQIFNLSKIVKPNKSNKKFTILTVSADYPHKNLKIIPKIAKILEDYEEIEFIVTTKGEGHYKNVNYIGNVKISDLPQLYSTASILLLPTLLECFTATYLEAMISEIPIITTDLAFAKDLCGNAAIYCDALNPEDFAAKIISLYENKEKSQSLIHNGNLLIKTHPSSYDRMIQYQQIIFNETDNTRP